MKKHFLALALILAVATLAVAQDASHVHFTRVYRPGEAIPAAGQNITYYGGPLMTGGADVYVVYYGNWTTNDQNIINTLLSHLGGTGLFNINTTYYDSLSTHPVNVVNFNSTTNTYHDNYSLGKKLTDASVQTIVKNAIDGGHLPNDVNGVYFVLTYRDVSETAFGGGFCSLFCGYHSPSTSIEAGETINYSFVGDSAKCSSGCDGNVAIFHDRRSPNNDVGADGTINVMFHELSETVTDPQVNLNTAWNSGTCGENGDCCNFNFGATTVGTNGAHYNQTINGKHYLIQQMFELTGTGFTSVPGTCAQSF